jgi:hypothetical protein
MDIIAQTRKLFFRTPTTPIINKIKAHATYYPPDISVVKLANQDKRLDCLKLRDFKLFEQAYAQDRLIKRGKSVRVHVITGPNKDFEKTKKSKSRRK